MQRYGPRKTLGKRKQVVQYVIDGALTKVGPESVLIWVAVEPGFKKITAINTSKERNTFVAEKLISGLIKTRGKNPASTGGGRWYPQARSAGF
jgi:transposase-like protein